MPAHVRQARFGLEVPSAVGVNLGLPERRPGLGKPEQMAVMLMPEAAMDKHYCPVLRQNKVRAAR